ncbi:aldose epimerase family protein [Tateyamaria armeniaca]|uniref:Aldose epimerase family protein n=1 Tax=Tateyamaria armeniaca TaxID=2518930 RepID=A0ABW8UVY0_9RHOB
MTDEITLSSDALTARFSAHGARLEMLRLVDGPSLVLHADAADHPTWRSVYPGAIVGPVANRVTGGRVRLGGHIYQMPCNENSITALHSGPNGLDQRVWEVKGQTQNALHLQLTLADGDGGLPGNRTIDVRYVLDGATLSLTIAADTDAPTPINIAHHPYWRLGDASAHLLQVDATHYLPVDARNVPTGEIAAVAGTVFDHTSPKPLDPDIDHNFCVRRNRRENPRHVATLTGADGLAVDIESTEPGLQVYAGAYLPTLAGTDITPLAGVAMEPQGWPDAVNHDAFPSILCAPDTPYRQITRYRIRRAT